jgi:hypothetical protein
MNDKLEMIIKEAVVAYLRYCSRKCLGGLNKSTIELCQGSLCSGRDSNRAPPEHKARASPIQQPSQFQVSCRALISSITSTNVMAK